MTTDLVLVHGWALSREVWASVIPGLSECFKVHNLDLPGYGEHPGGATGCNGDAHDCLDQWTDEVQACAPAGAVWMGWSLGAMVVMNLMRRGGAVKAAVLVAPTPRFTVADDWDAGMEPDFLRGFIDGVRGDVGKVLKRFLMLQAGGSEHPRAVSRALAECLPAPIPDPAVLRMGLRILECIDFRENLKEMDEPILVIHGTGDRVVPQAAGAWLAGRVPRGELVTLDAGHAPFVTRPEAFNEAVLSWI